MFSLNTLQKGKQCFKSLLLGQVALVVATPCGCSYAKLWLDV